MSVNRALLSASSLEMRGRNSLPPVPEILCDVTGKRF